MLVFRCMAEKIRIKEKILADLFCAVICPMYLSALINSRPPPDASALYSGLDGTSALTNFRLLDKLELKTPPNGGVYLIYIV